MAGTCIELGQEWERSLLVSLLKEVGVHSEGPGALMMSSKGKRGNRI